MEIFRVRTQEEINNKLGRRERRKRQKTKQKGETEPAEDEDEEEAAQVTPDILLTQVAVIRPPAKVRSVAYLPSTDSERSFKVMAALHNNTIEVYSVDHAAKPADVSQTSSIELPGHRSDVRTVAVSSDDQIFLSASNSTFFFFSFLSSLFLFLSFFFVVHVLNSVSPFLQRLGEDLEFEVSCVHQDDALRIRPLFGLHPRKPAGVDRDQDRRG